MRDRVAWTLAASLVLVASFAACGARTELDGLNGEGGGANASGGGSGRRDAGRDAPDDVVVHTEDCVAGQAAIYVVDLANLVYRFDPTTGRATRTGDIDCTGDFPASIAVDRHGGGWLLFERSGLLAKFSTPKGGCRHTEFERNQHGFHAFAMAFATDEGGPAEKLYVAETSQTHPSRGLATIDTETLKLDFIAPFSEDLGDAVALTGTGDGRLFGLFLATPGPGSHLAEIDKSSGEIKSDKRLSIGVANETISLAFWGGSFYVFTDDGHGGGTTVTKYDPTTDVESMVVDIGMSVLAGGVSTCAPE